MDLRNRTMVEGICDEDIGVFDGSYDHMPISNRFEGRLRGRCDLGSRSLLDRQSLRHESTYLSNGFYITSCGLKYNDLGH